MYEYVNPKSYNIVDNIFLYESLKLSKELLKHACILFKYILDEKKIYFNHVIIIYIKFIIKLLTFNFSKFVE